MGESECNVRLTKGLSHDELEVILHKCVEFQCNYVCIFCLFVYYLGHCHGDVNFFYIVLVHELLPLIKYVIHQLSSVVYVGQDLN